MRRYTPPRPWEPLSDAEFAALRPFFARQTSAGRPLHDLRGRLDAIFRLVTTDGPWHSLPQEHGPWDTAHRQFRRWAHAGVWSCLLIALGQPRIPPALRALEHWICRAYRRALRLLKLPGIVLARRLGLLSALPAPPFMLPDRDLSETLMPAMLAMLNPARGLPSRATIRLVSKLHRLIGGITRIPRRWAPP